ncbi:MAG TPA: hypothetical protein PKN48_00850 [Bacteroidales bacterium]|nr:hypothetical protein [Bacteroidales bacterium]
MGKYFNKTGIEKAAWLTTAIKAVTTGLKALKFSKVAPTVAMIAAPMAADATYLATHGPAAGNLLKDFSRVKSKFRTPQFPLDSFSSERAMINRANEVV